MDKLTDQVRYPTLSEAGSRMLKFLREHPSAPIFRNQSGNCLTSEDIKVVKDFEREVMQSKSSWHAGSLPEWLAAFVRNCYEKVPFYKKLGDVPTKFSAIPTIRRSNFSRDIASFVPTDLELERLINFQTTGVTGHPLLLPSHPVVAASYLSFIKKALLRHGVSLTHGSGQVGVLLLGYQRKCFTYTSVTPTMEESGLVKINLHPNDWRNLEDRERYIDALQAEVFTGDPICYSELLKLDLRWSPKAMISTSMRLFPELKEKLELKITE
jgi:phenylacetate-CoA ligase